MIDKSGDIDALLNDFGQTVIVAGNTIKADFTDATEGVSLLDGQVEANAPTLICKTADVEDVDRKAAVTVDGRNFTVERNERVGVGVSVLYLKT